MSIGIASVARPSGTSYLLQTVERLIDSMSDMDKKDTYIVIFLADLYETPKSTAKAGISRTFGKYIEQGLLIVIEAYPEYYPPLTNIKEKLGDSDGRRTWRSKQNVDISFVMCYCKDLSQYYIHLEDDVISAPSFFPKLRDFIAAQPDNLWPMLDAAKKGCIARVCHSQDLENIASYFYLMYDEMPIDWLMIQWRGVKDQEPNNRQFRLPPASLFQHIGDVSSFKENRNPNQGSDKEPYFDKYEQKYKGLNPPARVTSSLSSHQGKPQDAYEKGDGYFWGKDPKKGDYVLIEFNTPTAVREVFVDTGSHLAWKDILRSGVLQVSFESAGNNLQLKNNNSCGHFKLLGSFDSGKIKISSRTEPKKVVCLLIIVTQDQNEWIYLREIDVW